MNHDQVPGRALAAHPTSFVAKIGPPPGISREHCTDAHVLVGAEYDGDGMGLIFRAYFKPSEAEVEQLRNGGFVEVFLRGENVVPFGANVFGGETQPEPDEVP